MYSKDNGISTIPLRDATMSITAILEDRICVHLSVLLNKNLYYTSGVIEYSSIS